MRDTFFALTLQVSGRGRGQVLLETSTGWINRIETIDILGHVALPAPHECEDCWDYPEACVEARVAVTEATWQAFHTDAVALAEVAGYTLAEEAEVETLSRYGAPFHLTAPATIAGAPAAWVEAFFSA